MAGEIIVNQTSEAALEIATKLGTIGLWLQTVGLIVILWFVFAVINFILNRKKSKQLEEIKEQLNRIEEKLKKR